MQLSKAKNNLALKINMAWELGWKKVIKISPRKTPIDQAEWKE